MSRKAIRWLSGLGVLEIIVLALTIHATVTYHRTRPDQASVISIGPVIGWIIAVIVLTAIVLILKESRR